MDLFYRLELGLLKGGVLPGSMSLVLVLLDGTP